MYEEVKTKDVEVAHAYQAIKITKVVELGERRLVSMATGSEMKFPTLYVTRQP